jgi:hypothetical protein
MTSDLVFSGVQDVMMGRSEIHARSGHVKRFLSRMCHMKRTGGK